MNPCTLFKKSKYGDIVTDTTVKAFGGFGGNAGIAVLA